MLVLTSKPQQWTEAELGKTQTFLAIGWRKPPFCRVVSWTSRLPLWGILSNRVILFKWNSCLTFSTVSHWSRPKALQNDGFTLPMSLHLSHSKCLPQTSLEGLLLGAQVKGHIQGPFSSLDFELFVLHPQRQVHCSLHLSHVWRHLYPWLPERLTAVWLGRAAWGAAGDSLVVDCLTLDSGTSLSTAPVNSTWQDLMLSGLLSRCH